jgi:hypothetical protein
MGSQGARWFEFSCRAQPGKLTDVLDALWWLWRQLCRMVTREPEDESEEGPVETAFQISCLIVALLVGLVICLA